MCPAPRQRASISIVASRDSVTRYTDRISASGFADGAIRSGDARVALFGELESYQRFVVLAGELDDVLSASRCPSLDKSAAATLR